MSNKIFRHDDYEEDWQRSQRRKERDNARRQRRVVVDDWVDPRRLAAFQAAAEAEPQNNEPEVQATPIKIDPPKNVAPATKVAATPTRNLPEPNETTHIIKGNQINFDRVIDVVKVESDHEGKRTFGIKFIFRGSSEKRELARIAWFNINQKERDRVFIIETNFWHSLQQQ